MTIATPGIHQVSLSPFSVTSQNTRIRKGTYIETITMESLLNIPTLLFYQKNGFFFEPSFVFFVPGYDCGEHTDILA